MAAYSMSGGAQAGTASARPSGRRASAGGSSPGVRENRGAGAG